MCNATKLEMKNNNWKYTLIRVLLFCICNVIILILSSAMTKGLPESYADILHGIITLIAIFGNTLLFSRWEKVTLFEIGVVPNQMTIKRFVFGFGIGSVLALTHALVVIFFIDSKLVFVPSLSLSPILSTLLLYFVFSLREELAFRAFPLRTLAYSIGSWKAQIIIAIIFAIEHMAGGYTFKQAFLGSAVGAILFGIAALKTKGIALPVGLHLAWNFGQWCVGFKNEPGIWENIIVQGSESKNEQIVFIVYLIVMGLAILGFYLYRPKNSVVQST